MSINWQINTFASVDSTQDILKEALDSRSLEGIVVQALEQKNGRGRYGRQWVSPMGNLYLSFLLKPLCSADVAGQLSFVVSLALSKAMEVVLVDPSVLTLKWPNDLLLCGQKSAGILLETSLDENGIVENLIVGVGVNIFSSPEGAATLKDFCGDNRLAIHPFRDDFLSALDTYYDRWKQEGFAFISQKWLEKAHGLGDEVSVKVGRKKTDGVFKGLDEQGHMILEDLKYGKETKITAGEVFFGKDKDI